MSERFALGTTNCRRAMDVISSVEAAERLGAEAAFVAEDINCRDTFELCALASARTSTIRLATGVVNPYTRSPTSLAMAIATLDEVSEGRAVLGLGTSSPSLIVDQMGIPGGSPVAVMREATEIILALLAGGSVSYAGKRFVYTGARLEVAPVQARIPVFFAAMGPMMLRLAGAMADGVLLNVGASCDYVRWAIEEIRTGALAAGRDPEVVTVAAWLTAYVTEDREAGFEKAREWLATMLSIPRQGELLIGHGGGDPEILPGIRALLRAYPHEGDRVAAGKLVPDEMAENMTLIGGADRIRERLAEYRGAGVQLPVLGLAALRTLYG